MIKRHFMAILLSVSMAFCAVGCGSTEESASDIEQSTTAIEEVEEVRELNIIDDNYRNYYEIFVHSFYDSDGDGIGDINGVTKKLDYIKDMGFNGIWLMPVFSSPSYHKYDTVDYYTVDPEYGTNEDLKNLINECHKNGIRVIIDLAINHTSSKHPWFTEASKYLRSLPEGGQPDANECKYVDYYNFSKEKLSNDYYNILSGTWFYEGVFWSEMPDLNLKSDAVRKEIEDIAKFWLDLGIDGFRMDAAVHYEESDIAFNTEVLNWFYSYCKGINPDVYMVSEVWSGQSEIANYYKSETPSFFNFAAAGAEGKLIKTGRGTAKAESFVKFMISCQEEYGANYPEYIDAPFITNHDMPRVANNLMSNPNDMKMTCGLMMTMNGSPFVYYGEEIGMSSKGDKDENKRLPMIWQTTAGEGTTKAPEGADSAIESKFPCVEEQLVDNNSILNYYKRAIRLRNENPEIARGKVEVIDELCEGHQAVITKTYNDSMIAICYNTSSEPITVNLSGTSIEDYSIQGYLTIDNSKIVKENTSITLPGKSICVLK